MNRPIQSGDTCEIIGGVFPRGPNLGKIVKVVSLQGQHSKFGNIWRVSGDTLVSEFGGVGHHVDCAQSWLRRIDPETPGTKALDRELTAQ